MSNDQSKCRSLSCHLPWTTSSESTEDPQQEDAVDTSSSSFSTGHTGSRAGSSGVGCRSGAQLLSFEDVTPRCSASVRRSIFRIEAYANQVGVVIVLRRFRDFGRLEAEVRGDFPKLAPLPSRGLVSRAFQKRFLVDRARALADYLDALLEVDPAVCHPALRQFLGLAPASLLSSRASKCKDVVAVKVVSSSVASQIIDDYMDFTMDMSRMSSLGVVGTIVEAESYLEDDAEDDELDTLTCSSDQILSKLKELRAFNSSLEVENSSLREELSSLCMSV